MLTGAGSYIQLRCDIVHLTQRCELRLLKGFGQLFILTKNVSTSSQLFQFPKLYLVLLLLTEEF